jgi:hypothetical protein
MLGNKYFMNLGILPRLFGCVVLAKHTLNRKKHNFFTLAILTGFKDGMCSCI